MVFENKHLNLDLLKLKQEIKENKILQQLQDVDSGLAENIAIANGHIRPLIIVIDHVLCDEGDQHQELEDLHLPHLPQNDLSLALGVVLTEHMALNG